MITSTGDTYWNPETSSHGGSESQSWPDSLFLCYKTAHRCAPAEGRNDKLIVVIQCKATVLEHGQDYRRVPRACTCFHVYADLLPHTSIIPLTGVSVANAESDLNISPRAGERRDTTARQALHIEINVTSRTRIKSHVPEVSEVVLQGKRRQH